MRHGQLWTPFGISKRKHALDWSSFDTAMGLLDRAIEELRQPVRNLPPTLLVAGGFPAAMAHLIEEIQAADVPTWSSANTPPRQIVPPEWKQAAVRITQESLANACRHSKSNRIFLELSLDGNVLRIHARDWGVGFKPDRKHPTLRTGQNLPTTQAARRHSDDRQ